MNIDDDDVTQDVVVVGRIGAPFGVRGWVNLQSFTVPKNNILNYQPWYLQERSGRWQALQSFECKSHKKGFIALIDHISERELCAQYTGLLVGVASSALPHVADRDEYYWRDLEGCRVITQAGDALGTVDHLQETGAHDLLVVKTLDAAGKKAPLLIPFVAQYVLGVDLAQQQILVDWDTSW